MESQVNLPMNHVGQKREVIRLAIITAGGLMVMKMVIGVVTLSMAVIASAVDSLMDILVSTVNYISLREASKPADHEHAYGHGKIESLASLFQSLIISGSGLFLIYVSVRRLADHRPLVFIEVGVVVMVISTIVTFFLIRKLQAVSKSTGSPIVGTETLHFKVDLLTNVGIIIALLLVRSTGLIYWDLMIALVIAVYILRESFRIMRNSIDELIDRALPDEIQDDVRRTVLNFDRRVLGMHNFRTRQMGNQKFMEFHVEVPKTLGFQEAHELTEDLIDAVKQKYPGSDVNVHYDPEGAR